MKIVKESPKKPRICPRGRPISDEARAAVDAALRDERPRRDRLIEYLHRLQDRHGYLAAAHLAALAERLRLAETEVYEVATFYAHFDVVKEEETPPAAVTVRVCENLSCVLAGAERLLRDLEAAKLGNVRIKRAPCMGRCADAPAAMVGKRAADCATPASVKQIIAGSDFTPEIPAYRDLARYRADSGYGLFHDLRAGKVKADAIITALEESGLRGMGGAGFPTGRKWRLVAAQAAPKYLVVNGDEGEPGTFKDRYYLESDPHRMLEGLLIAAHVIQAERAYIYLRDEYPAAHEILTREITALEQAGLSAPGFIELRRGAGAYICGEESAMLESIEGKRGLPRHKPPYAAEVGLFDRPTLINNIETLHWVRDIVERGAAWFADQGRRERKGLRSFSVSGRVKEPGVKLAPAGITLRELVDEYCGGMADGHELKGYLPGGASGGILPASLADEPLDFGALEKHGSFIGSAAVVVLSYHDDIADAALNLLRFFEDESCGQCTPCRVGTEKAVACLSAARWDETLLKDLAQVMSDASICGLGQAAANSYLSALRYFRDELQLAETAR